MFVNGLEPAFGVFEGLFVSEIESQNDAVSLSVELVSNCLKSLLTSRVPKFYFKLGAINHCRSFDVVNSHSLDVDLIDLLFIKSLKNRSLTDLPVPYYHDVDFPFHFVKI